MVEVVRTTAEGRVRFDLRQLEARAPELMAEGLDELRDHLDELLELDLRGRPRVRLLVALLVAQARPDDPRADELVRAAWRSFQRGHDDEGLSLAAYVQGCLAEARGNMVAAAEWWSRSREGGHEALPLQEGGLVDHGLEAWYESDITTARRFGEQGIELARSRANLNDEARGVTLLAILACHEGDFEGADRLAADGLAGADPDDHAARAVLSCARAVVANHWGHDEDRRRWFELAVTTAENASKPTPAFHGVALALQAEMGVEEPAEDRLRQAWAAAALLSGELPWWRRIAVRAVAVTAAAAGDREASDTALDSLLAEDVDGYERGRALLVRAANRQQFDDDPALDLLQEAYDQLAGADARFWAARAALEAAVVDAEHAGEWRDRAVALSTGDPAFVRLLRTEHQLEIRGGSGVLAGVSGGTFLDGEPVAFLTRHAELTLYLLILAGRNGLTATELASRLWPEAPARRHRPRLRTCLWQIRKSLGEEHWRLRRTPSQIFFDADGVVYERHQVAEMAERFDI
jgi:hypothetical protein